MSPDNPTTDPVPPSATAETLVHGGGEAAVSGAVTQGHGHKPRKHKAHIEHKVPGRIRMKVPMAKDNPEILALYQDILANVPGVIEVKVKPKTGSIVLHYDLEHEHHFEHNLHSHCADHLHVEQAAPPEDEVSEMARRIESEAEFLAEHSQVARTALDFFRAFDREMKAATDNTIDLKIVLAGGLAAFTFLEIGAEAATPMWVTLALFTLNHFAELRHDTPSLQQT